MVDDPAPSRRGFLDVAMRGGLAACAGAMAVPVGLYLLPAGSRGPGDRLVPAGPAEGLEAPSARLIEADGRPILLLAAEEGAPVRAFSAICTHLGCIVKWDPATRTILCPCHAGVFGADGRVLSGPPPRPLPEYPVIRTGDELKVKL